MRAQIASAATAAPARPDPRMARANRAARSRARASGSKSGAVSSRSPCSPHTELQAQRAALRSPSDVTFLPPRTGGSGHYLDSPRPTANPARDPGEPCAMRAPRAWRPVAVGLVFLAQAASSCTGIVGTSPSGAVADAGIHKIRHVIVIMQENRSFDSSFGTFPGADGIPMRDGRPVPCLPEPGGSGCVRPTHDARDRNVGGPHQAGDARADIDGGRMDGFVRRAVGAIRSHRCRTSPGITLEPGCGGGLRLDVVDYHDDREIPNYWTYARRFVLQDHMFAPNLGWSLPSHLFMVSGWSARCSDPRDPATCQSALDRLDPDRSGQPDYGWTDLTYLLHRAGVSWAYYLEQGYQPDCDDGAITCSPRPQKIGTPEIWNPLPDFVTVHLDGQLGNVRPAADFFTAA